MISTETQDNKVLVLAKGNINLLVEPESRRRPLWAQMREHGAVIAASSLSATAASVIVTLVATAGMHGREESRLERRIEQLDRHLEALLANAGSRTDQQSDRLMARVDRIGDRVDVVGQNVEGIRDDVSALPDTIERSAESTGRSLVGWLSALKPGSKTKPPPLTVHAPERRRASP